MIVVIGGGITGLVVGWELANLGADALVLEAGAQAGGVIRSSETDGRVLDFGPQRTRMTPGFAQCVHELGLGEEVIAGPADLDLFVFRDGALRRVPLSLGELALSDIVGVAGKARMLLEPLTGPADPSERVATYFRRKIGNELYESVAGPLFGGLYGTDPADMMVGRTLWDTLGRLGVRRSLLVALARHGASRASPAAPCSFREGMGALPRALAHALGDRFRPLTPVRRLTRSGSGWKVWTEGVGSPVEAEHVVLATPADASASMITEVAPDLAHALGGLRYNHIALVHLDADTDLRGLGFQMALSERGSLLRGVTYNHSLFGPTRHNLYTAFLGGSRHPQVAQATPAWLADQAASAFRDTTGFAARPLHVELTRMPAWDTSWSVLDGISVPRGIHVANSWVSRPGLPGRFAEARQVAASLIGGPAPAAQRAQHA